MEIKNIHIIGIIVGAVVLITSIFFYGTKFFLFLIGVAVITAILPFVVSVIRENAIASEKEQMFLEFTRNLVESVKIGTPISKSIINVRNKPFGVLGPNIKKLANQISIGIPLSNTLQTFSRDVNNITISRSLKLIGQAEKAGGDIGQILESVAGAVSMSDRLNKERQSAISTLVIQGYIIFVVFITIVLVMQFKIVPLLSGMGGVEFMGGGGGELIDAEKLSQSFLYLLLAQGFFSGLAIGKFSGGGIKSGIKHSFAFMVLSFLVSSGASLFFGGA